MTLKYQPGAGEPVVTAVYPASPIVRTATGAYFANLDTTGWRGPAAAAWVIEWIGTGAVQAIAVDNWSIQPEPL